MVGEMIVVIGDTPGSPRSARVLHRALLGGLLTICAVFVLIALGLHDAPLMAAGDTASMVGYVLAACGVMPILLGLLILKPRVPMRSSGQDDAAFWHVALGPVISVWAVVEGAGIIGAVGALLTGSLAPGLAVAIALGCLVATGPSHFENA